MKGDRDGKSAKGVQQETACSAVVVNDHMHAYIIFSCLYDSKTI